MFMQNQVYTVHQAHNIQSGETFKPLIFKHYDIKKHNQAAKGVTWALLCPHLKKKNKISL